MASIILYVCVCECLYLHMRSISIVKDKLDYHAIKTADGSDVPVMHRKQDKLHETSHVLLVYQLQQ